MLLSLATTKIAATAALRSAIVLPRKRAYGDTTNSVRRCHGVLGGRAGREAVSPSTVAVSDSHNVESNGIEASEAKLVRRTKVQNETTAGGVQPSATSNTAILSLAAIAVAATAAATMNTFSNGTDKDESSQSLRHLPRRDDCRLASSWPWSYHYRPFVLTSCEASINRKENTTSVAASTPSSASITSTDFDGKVVSALPEDRRGTYGDSDIGATTTASVAKSNSILRRMTNVGRFSLLSETRSNPSVPVLVLTVTGDRNGNGPSTSSNGGESGPGSGSFKAEDFIRLYEQRGIGTKHPRFTARLDPTGSYFVHNDDTNNLAGDINDSDPCGSILKKKPKKTAAAATTTYAKSPAKNLSVVVRDVSYPVGGRAELVQWINQALLTPIPLDKTLWDVQVATGGTLGRSGAINPHRLNEIVRDHNNINNKATDQVGSGTSSVVESILVFRAHHCLGKNSE